LKGFEQGWSEAAARLAWSSCGRSVRAHLVQVVAGQVRPLKPLQQALAAHAAVVVAELRTGGRGDLCRFLGA
jgi:hypothetical protein